MKPKKLTIELEPDLWEFIDQISEITGQSAETILNVMIAAHFVRMGLMK